MKKCHSENLIVAQLVKNFPPVCGTRRFITVLTGQGEQIQTRGRDTDVPVKDDGRIAIPVWEIYPKNECGDENKCSLDLKYSVQS
jgi:hypothetical protein